MIILTHNLRLPNDYQVANFLSFHQRDHQQLAERVHQNRLDKGFIWGGYPAHLSIHFNALQAHAKLQLNSDTELHSTILDPWPNWIQYFLGITQATDKFAYTHQQHPELGPILRSQHGLRIAQTSSPFEAISWAVIGQQISVAAAISIRRRFIQLAGVQHLSGLWCYPDASSVAQLTIEQLRSIGLSPKKASTIATISQMISSQVLKFPTQVTSQNIAQLRAELLAIPGVGPWTINYTLMRGLAWLDSSLHDDAAVRRYLQTLLKLEKITAKQAEQWLLQFSPWRSLVAAHLWQSRGLSA
ncbi:3-methyladenine DNA glycosylase 2 [Denitrificimonas sp. JX-1]|uniref:DNA-3-methyladenine glycosylase II n=1 Tax=Denitrificimonas halotolerans TaxID=3098930 RepID=A0ABU5GMQ2_9GAMM|nr:3-methyladenine DNA glycosylase 2 [Denitrificimonas sp. JX-1]MDY7218171.1 3-methyladenine DNA glycosylase 2 [Denitrificimonas sp. JX-1]